MLSSKRSVYFVLLCCVLIAVLSPLPATIQVGFPVLARTSTNGNNTYANWAGSLTPGDCPTIDANHNLADSGSATCGGVAAQVHAVSFVINGGGSTIATGDAFTYVGTGASSGTINRVDISGGGTAGATCSITVDIWKRNAAIPGSGNKISASAPATLSTANLSQSGSLSGWGLSVAANDVWDANVATVTGCIQAIVQIWYQ